MNFTDLSSSEQKDVKIDILPLSINKKLGGLNDILIGMIIEPRDKYISENFENMIEEFPMFQFLCYMDYAEIGELMEKAGFCINLSNGLLWMNPIEF